MGINIKVETISRGKMENKIEIKLIDVIITIIMITYNFINLWFFRISKVLISLKAVINRQVFILQISY
jgi:hypothetical protein